MGRVPTDKDFKLWKEALQKIVPAGGLLNLNRLGSFNYEGYKVWE